MIRVLNIFGSLNRGGSETMVMNYYRKLDRSKIQFDFVVHSQDEGAYEKEIKELGGAIYRVRRFNGVNIISYIRDWRKLLSQHPEWTTIHCHFYTIAGVVFWAARSFSIKKKIVHAHNNRVVYPLFKRIGNSITRYFANRLSTHRFACGEDAGRYYFGKRSFIIMNNAIDTEKFNFNAQNRVYKRNELNVNDKFVIGHIGSFTIQKNHKFLVEIFNEIYNRDNSAVMVLVGVGSPIKEQTKSRISELGLSDSVIFTGSRPDVPELMQAMDMFLLPSLWEGLPVSVIEAQAAGLPILMSDSITDKVAITTLVETLSLDKSAEIWAKRALVRRSRVDTHNTIYEAGYDIHSNVKWLENFYLN